MYTRLAVAMLATRFSVAAIAAVAVVAADLGASDLGAADLGAANTYWTNVEAGFANMLSHEPYYGPTAVTVNRGEKDPVELALHWREPRTTRLADPGYWENVNAGFATMLDHAPYPGPTDVTVARGGKDPIEVSLHADAKQAAVPAERLASDADPVRASFARMLDHTPYAGPTAVTVERGTRDLVERIVFEMLQDVRDPVRLARR